VRVIEYQGGGVEREVGEGREMGGGGKAGREMRDKEVA
jgi:hypothetical protein